MEKNDERQSDYEAYPNEGPSVADQWTWFSPRQELFAHRDPKLSNL